MKKPAKSATSSDSANSKQPEPAPAPRILPGAIPGVTFRQIKKYVEIKKARARPVSCLARRVLH